MKNRWLIAPAGLLFCSLALGANASSIETAMSNFQQAGASINAKLVPLAMKTACAACLLQWIFGYWKELFSGDLSSVLAKAVGILSWFFGSMALLQNVDLLSNFYSGYLKLAGNLAGVSAMDFTPSAVITEGQRVLSVLWSGAMKTMGEHAWQIAQNFVVISVLVMASLIIMASYFMVALGLFVTNLEFWMLFAVAPLAFGLIPLAAFRDQGTAPIKGAISLGLRILILGVVVAVAKQLTDTAVTTLANVKAAEGEALLSIYWGYLAGIFGCGLMALSAGKIANSIASGSANFSGSDAIRTGMTIAATAGAGGAAAGALASGAAKTAGPVKSAISKGVEGLRDAMATKVRPYEPSTAKATGNTATGAPEGAGYIPGSDFGGPPARVRPSLENTKSVNTNDSSSAPASPSPSAQPQAAGSGNTAPGGGSPAEKPSTDSSNATKPTAPAGNANTANIGAGTNTSTPSPYKPPSALDKMIASVGDAAQQHAAHDSNSVGIQMHISKE